MKTRDIALMGLMTAIVFVVTRAFVIAIPQTKGFFNLGESAVYLAAVLFGARVGAVAGGIGSAVADLSLGYASFAPFTLVIKGLEGFVVGALGQKSRNIVALIGAMAGAALGIWALTINSWLVRSAGVAVVLAALVAVGFMWRKDARRTGARIAAMVSGGLLMIFGYFITEAYIMGLGVQVAFVEVPYNTVQMAVGIAAGLVASTTFEEALLAPQR